ncbi:blood vessel epicardial substance-like [Mya arenaria]|uniref:blood vessel epicardial substance-like n=1 Tax=Mya arenaria TaxID=6604 RepID=UPI0022E18D9E|nr:blood vessel epicardial substance-like [Mya arenaria]
MENASVVSLVEDAQFANDSLITTHYSSQTFGCHAWKVPHHPLFQVANGVLFLGLLCPNVKHGLLALHGLFVFGFLLMSVWSWVILCAPDYFSWNFAFMMINVVQTFLLLYHLKPIRFEEDLERLYRAVFEPMNVSRRLFKKLTDENFCILSTLYEGDAYAIQAITKTDRLGMLLTGTMKVYSHQNLLHYIQETEFIDSPEFESSVTGDEKFQVSVYAGSLCRYMYWPRQSLEYLLMKEPFLATVLNTILGRDITNKLYALNSRAKEPGACKHSDPSAPSQGSADGREGDLRRTLAQLSPHHGNIPAGHRRSTAGEVPVDCLQEEVEESDEASDSDVEMNLLSVEDKVNNHSRSSPVQALIGVMPDTYPIHGISPPDICLAHGEPLPGCHLNLGSDSPQVRFNIHGSTG